MGKASAVILVMFESSKTFLINVHDNSSYRHFVSQSEKGRRAVQLPTDPSKSLHAVQH